MEQHLLLAMTVEYMKAWRDVEDVEDVENEEDVEVIPRLHIYSIL